MKGTYEIIRKSIDGYDSTYGYESNKQRAIKEAIKISGKVKEYLTGKIIYE